MQVLENAVRKLKTTSHAEELPQRIEPRFENTPKATPVTPAPVAHPIENNVRHLPADDVSVGAREPAPTVVRRPEPPKVELSPTVPVLRAERTTAPIVSAAGTPDAPLFRDLPEPAFEDDTPAKRDTHGGGGGGGGGSGSGQDDEDDDRPYAPWLTGLAAAASIALILGVSVWTYQLGQRDAREVPIVAALEGPARVAPENRGGMEVAHKGHSVNTVLEGRGVERVASAVTIAPADRDLTDEDAPSSELQALVASRTPKARPEGIAETPTAVAPVAEAPKVVTPVTTADAANEGTPKALTPNGTVVAGSQAQAVESEQVAAAAPVLPAPTPGEDLAPQTNVASASEPISPEAVRDDIATPGTQITAVEPEAEAIEAPVVVAETGDTEAAAPVEKPESLEVAALGPLPPMGEGSAYAPAMMKLPVARPKNLNVAMANAVNAALDAVLSESTDTPELTRSEPAVQPVQTASGLDVIPLPAGTRMIQLGAYGSEEVARQQWDRLSAQHDDLLGSKEHYVQRTNNSGKIFYRLRVAGYESKTDTQSACTALSARGLPCITVTLR